KQRLQLIRRNQGKESRARDLCAIQVENREDGAIARGIEKSVGMPTGGAGTCFGFAVTHHAAGEKIRVIENSPISMKKGIPEFSPLIYRSRRFGSHMTGDASGKRELTEQTPHSVDVLRNGGIEFGIRAFQPGVSHDAGTAMPRSA